MEFSGDHNCCGYGDEAKEPAEVGLGRTAGYSEERSVQLTPRSPRRWVTSGSTCLLFRWHFLLLQGMPIHSGLSDA